MEDTHDQYNKGELNGGYHTQEESEETLNKSPDKKDAPLKNGDKVSEQEMNEKHRHTENETKEQNTMSQLHSEIKDIDSKRERIINFYINCTSLGDNSRTIQVGRDVNGNILQNTAETQYQQKEIVLSLKSKEEISLFINTNSKTTALAAAIVLSLLDTVPLAYMHELCELLYSCLYNEDDSENRDDRFTSYDEILKRIDAALIDGTKYNETGKTILKCISFKNIKTSSKFLDTVYFSFPQFRKGIFVFLYKIKGNKKYNALAVQIRKAYSKLSVLDFDYFHDTILPEFAKLSFDEDILYLTEIIKELLKVNRYKTNTENLLNHWLTVKNSRLFMVVLQLYGQGFIDDFGQRIKRTISMILKQEQEIFVREMEYEISNQLNDLLFYAHIYHTIAEILIGEIANLYGDKNDNNQKFYFSMFFLIMFHLDYLCVYKHSEKLIFVEGYCDKKTRYLLCPLFQFIWNKNMNNNFLRNQLCMILQFYLKEADEKSYSCEYMKNFFLFLCVSNPDNTEYSIDLVMNFFKKCYKEKIYTAKDMGTDVLNHLKNRNVYGGN